VSLLVVDNIEVRYGNIRALKGVSLDVGETEFLHMT
jgi:ABC-type branched-subunit amino acid transport system ATPase component